MNSIYLIRHGDYDFRDQRDAGVGQGLTERGRQQARLTADYLQGRVRARARLLCSDLVRAMQTAQFIADGLGLPRESRTDLRECLDTDPRSFDVWPEREEAAFQAYFLEYFQTEERVDEDLVLVCHANLIRYFVYRIQCLLGEEWGRPYIGTCSISQFDVAPDGRLIPVGIGDTDHLPDALI